MTYTTNLFSHSVKAENPKSGNGQGWFLLRAVREESVPGLFSLLMEGFFPVSSHHLPSVQIGLGPTLTTSIYAFCVRQKAYNTRSPWMPSLRVWFHLSSDIEHGEEIHAIKSVFLLIWKYEQYVKGVK